MPNRKKRSVFFISDGTGITAEALGQSLLTQFESIEFERTTLPYIDTENKAKNALQQIEQAASSQDAKPLIFTTLVNKPIRHILNRAPGKMIDLFETFLVPLEEELQSKSSYTVGVSHGVGDKDTYKTRIDAVNFALNNDDGNGTQRYPEADIILVGVSRCGKTPTCLYLALQFGVLAANYPLTEEELSRHQLPDCLKRHKDKLFALTIDAHRLRAIRQERRPNSRYSSKEQCRREIIEAQDIMRREKVPYLDTSELSVEEIATKKFLLQRVLSGRFHNKC